MKQLQKDIIIMLKYFSFKFIEIGRKNKKKHDLIFRKN